jgi:hypothetical protein
MLARNPDPDSHVEGRYRSGGPVVKICGFISCGRPLMPAIIIGEKVLSKRSCKFFDTGVETGAAISGSLNVIKAKNFEES